MRRSTDTHIGCARFAAIILIGLFLSGCAARDRNNPQNQAQWNGATILVGIDGLRWDYPERYELDSILEIGNEGVRVRSLIPVFPTKTFPNFYSLATGLYPNHTGILDNTIYDPLFDSRFRMRDTSAVRDGAWWGGEPLWVTAERQGKRSAVFFWPGSEAEISGHRPTFWKAFDGSVPDHARVEQTLDWLALPPEERPSLLLLYFELVDEVGHRYGPDAEETGHAARQVDSLISRLRSAVAERDLDDEVNIVIVSDHGLAERSPDQVIYLEDYIDLETAGILSVGQHVTLWPKPEAVDSVYLALADAHPDLKVYKRDDIPARFHLAGHRRTPPVIAVPSTGWTVSTRRSDNARLDRYSGAAHGYDNREPDMHGIFVAEGPSFQSEVVIDSLRAVDVYNIVARSIGLEPAPNDGDASVVPRVLEYKYLFE